MKVTITIIEDDNGGHFEEQIYIYPVKEGSLDKDKLWEYFEIVNNRIETERINYFENNKNQTP